MVKKPNKKTPEKKPKKFTLAYRLLVGEYPNWERVFGSKKEMDKMKKSPDDSTLKIAFLVRIIDLLREIRDEVKRERIIK